MTNIKKRAMITGVTGMLGSHLSEFLLDVGYDVFGVVRDIENINLTNIEHIKNDITLIDGDLSNQSSILRCINEVKPDEIYNLASQSSIVESWGNPEYTNNITGIGTLRVLDAIKEYDKTKVRLFQASSSEIFGNSQCDIFNECSPTNPRSPYGVSKLYAHWMVKNYREFYNMFACCGILFNVESERRSHTHVTRKISSSVARIHLGMQDFILLGNLDSKRDWGYAPDYVNGMWMMLQQDKPSDYVLATGELHTIDDFLREAFNAIGIYDYIKYIKIDSNFKRQPEINNLVGDYSKVKMELGWSPKTSFSDMVTIMVNNDIKLLEGYK